jgi:hypothetical protein
MLETTPILEQRRPRVPPPGTSTVADMAPLIRRVCEFLAQREAQTASWQAPYDVRTLAAGFGFTERRRGKPEVILAEQVAVELGHPSTPSLATVLLSWQAGLVRGGRISIVGPDLDGLEAGVRHPFAQVVMLRVRAGGTPDPFEVDTAQFLLHRLPGYMVRSVPGRLWARVSRSGRAGGLDLKTIGSALITAYMGEFEEVEAAEVVFVTSGAQHVDALRQVAIEANILAGRHRKLVLGVGGDIECRDLACDTCDDKPVCDNLRDIVIQRKARRDGRIG